MSTSAKHYMGPKDTRDPPPALDVPHDPTYTLRAFLDEPNKRNYRGPPGFRPARSVAESRRRMEGIIKEVESVLKTGKN